MGKKKERGKKGKGRCGHQETAASGKDPKKKRPPFGSNLPPGGSTLWQKKKFQFPQTAGPKRASNGPKTKKKKKRDVGMWTRLGVEEHQSDRSKGHAMVGWKEGWLFTKNQKKKTLGDWGKIGFQSKKPRGPISWFSLGPHDFKGGKKTPRTD